MTSIDKELLKGSTIVIILTILNRREMYGYELIKEIEFRSKGNLQPKEGTIYPVLHQLEREGAIASRWEGRDDERRRKYYRITGDGKKVLQKKLGEWRSFKGVMDQLLGGAS